MQTKLTPESHHKSALTAYLILVSVAIIIYHQQTVYCQTTSYTGYKHRPRNTPCKNKESHADWNDSEKNKHEQVAVPPIRQTGSIEEAEQNAKNAPERPEKKKRGRPKAASHNQLLGKRASMALWAASCWARFLLLPKPEPTTLPLRLTSTSKRLSWSGPDSPTRR